MRSCRLLASYFRSTSAILVSALMLSQFAFAQTVGTAPAVVGQGSNHGFQVGGNFVEIPPPASDMVEYSKDKGPVDSFVPPYNRLVVAFVPTGDKDSVVSITRKAPSRLALVQVSRQYESTYIDASNFKTIIASVASQFDSNVDSYAKENEEEFNKRLKSLDLDNAKITFEKPVSLGILYSEPNATAFGTVLAASAGQASITKALGVIYLHVKGRALFAYLFIDYKDQETIRELRTMSEEWTKAILKANQ
jgi:hypothetical protein